MLCSTKVVNLSNHGLVDRITAVCTLLIANVGSDLLRLEVVSCLAVILAPFAFDFSIILAIFVALAAENLIFRL